MNRGQELVPGTGVVESGNMSKLHKNNNYRKIYEYHFGEIPNGYHIHHIDGNALNNDISNLVCISAEEHTKIHNNSFVKWASVGGKIGGNKCKNEKLGFCGWGFEKRSIVNSGRKYTQESKDKKSKTLKRLYESGKMVHWSKLYDKTEVSEKIKQGDPGKSHRGKPAWNRGIKIEIKNPEEARLNKSIAALKRQKYDCLVCGKSFDKGNLTKHSKKCK